MNKEEASKKATTTGMLLTVLMALGILLMILGSSCSRYYTPEQAANTGGKKCSGRNSIR